MDVLVAVIILTVLLLALVLGVRAYRPGTTRRPPSAPGRADGDRVVVTLDAHIADPTAPAARRLVDEAATRAFGSVRSAQVIEVRDQSGAVVGRCRREGSRPVAIPAGLYEPHAPRHAAPEVVGSEGFPLPSPGAELPEVPRRPLAERFDLPPAMRALADPDDAVDLVVAILEAAGLDLEQDGHLIRVGSDGSEAVIVVRAPIGEPVDAEDLNHAYRLFRESRARTGVVVTPGFFDPVDVRRREAFAPALLHAGPDGIQRMADAVALGADPLRFAASPAVTAT